MGNEDSKVSKKEKIQGAEETIAILNAFIQQYHAGEFLSDEQAKRAVESGVVEITRPSGSHLGNGLLISDNGYFLTCSHCFDSYPARSRIRTADGLSYRISKVNVVANLSDVALGKAEIDGPSTTRTYRFYQRQFPERDELVAQVTRRDGEVSYKYGKVEFPGPLEKITGDGVRIDHHLIVSLLIKSGDSGSTIINPDKRIMGFSSLGTDISTKEWGSVVNIVRALEMLHHYKTHLEEYVK